MHKPIHKNSHLASPKANFNWWEKIRFTFLFSYPISRNCIQIHPNTNQNNLIQDKQCYPCKKWEIYMSATFVSTIAKEVICKKLSVKM